MAFLDDVAARLLASGLASSSGVGSYVLSKGWMPDSTVVADKWVSLYEYAGGVPNPRAELDSPGLQVVVRGVSMNKSTSGYQDAQSKADAIFRDLHALTLTTSSGRYYPGFTAQQSPFLMEFDAQRRPVFAVNFLAMRSRT